MSLFRDDFYTTKPSRRIIGRGSRRTPSRIADVRIWGAFLLLFIGVLIIVITLAKGGVDQPVSSGLWDAEQSSGQEVIGEGYESGSGQEEGGSVGGSSESGGSSGSGASGGNSGSTSSGSNSNAGSNHGSGSSDYVGDIEYRSEIAKATAKVYEAVVSIVMPNEEGADSEWDDIYAIGSGIIFRIIGNQALIVTNHHVASVSEELEIVLSNGERKRAELIGSDAISDLAVLRTDADGINKTATFGSSSDLQLGETAIAIGNPLGLGYALTITQGIVSSTQRSIPVSLSGTGMLDWEMEVIQTDAAINSGNSGGALININGEVIGINTMKIAWFGVEGLGFAIPIDMASPIIEELIERGRVSRPYIGIGGVNLVNYMGEDPLDLPDDVKGGAVIMSVEGPAKKAGLREYDVIVRLDDRKVNDMIDVRKYLYTEKNIGDPIEVTVYRNGRERTFQLELGELPN